MPTYIAMLKWTPRGLKDIKQSPARLDAARKAFTAAGVTMKHVYLVTGHLLTDGFGASRPVDTNDTLEGRARNRRVELTRE